MKSLRHSALIGATGLVLTSAAWAADMPGWPSARTPAVLQDFFSSWYVRGDLGYRFNAVSGGEAFGNPFASSTFADVFVGGGGVGFKARWFRADVTLDYGAQPRVTGTTVLGAPDVSANIISYTALVNAYVDLGTWSGFTPYVGAGVGMSHLQASDATAVLLVPGMPIDSPGTWNFSWAVTAGASYAIAANVLVDLSYRYLDLGQAVTSVAPLGVIEYGNQTAQELRIGLRYLID